MDLDTSDTGSTKTITPQPGPQFAFLSTPADIAIFGGSAGSGKTFCELLDPLHYIKEHRGFGGVIFRRTYPEIMNEGALWDTSWGIYPSQAAIARESDLTWTFPPFNNSISFRHIEHEKDVHKYQGSQICYIAFDELTTFTEYQFWYLLSRNRSACGVRPYVRATTNPDPDSWVKELILWYLDENGEYPDYSKSGVLRWFIRDRNELIWADSAEELIRQYGTEQQPKSFTFIPAKLNDNPILEQSDPGYRSRLMALPFVEQQQLLYGNWAVRLLAGMLFRAEWFEIIDTVPSGLRMVRAYDKAATEVSESNKNPDWTAGLLYATDGRYFYVLDLEHYRKRPGGVEERIQYTARNLDGPGVDILIEQEPGSAGVDDIEHYVRDVLYGFNVMGERPTGDKVTRAGIVSAAAQQKLIKILRGPWNLTFLRELVAFPTKGVHDDIVDSLSSAHLYLTRNAYGGNQAKSPIPQAAHKGVPISRTGVPAMYTEYNPGSDKMPRM
jgi:predicted phage terminase large subunit-like protein